MWHPQLAWANNVNFPTNKAQQPGFDPLVGQVVDSDNVGDRAMTGANPSNTVASLDLGIQIGLGCAQGRRVLLFTLDFCSAGRVR